MDRNSGWSLLVRCKKKSSTKWQTGVARSWRAKNPMASAARLNDQNATCSAKAQAVVTPQCGSGWGQEHGVTMCWVSDWELAVSRSKVLTPCVANTIALTVELVGHLKVGVDVMVHRNIPRYHYDVIVCNCNPHTFGSCRSE